MPNVRHSAQQGGFVYAVTDFACAHHVHADRRHAGHENADSEACAQALGSRVAN